MAADSGPVRVGPIDVVPWHVRSPAHAGSGNAEAGWSGIASPATFPQSIVRSSMFLLRPQLVPRSGRLLWSGGGWKKDVCRGGGNRRSQSRVKKRLSNDGVFENAPPHSACPARSWQRSPGGVSFEPEKSAKQTFALCGQVVDVANDAEEEQEGLKEITDCRFEMEDGRGRQICNSDFLLP